MSGLADGLHRGSAGGQGGTALQGQAQCAPVEQRLAVAVLQGSQQARGQAALDEFIDQRPGRCYATGERAGLPARSVMAPARGG
ncbi:MAG: hypothetical protein Q4E06_10360 [Lautropia sp.]|nr:hypothetical protein [Lautropia sp.]